MKDDIKLTVENIDFEKMVIDNVVKYAYIVDIDNYEMVYASEAFKKQFEIDDKDFKSAKCYELFRKCKKPCDLCNIDKLVENQVYAWQYYDERVNKDFKVKDYLYTKGNRKFRVSAGELCKSEYTLMESKDEIQVAVTQCVSLLAKDNDDEENISEILSIIRKFYNAEWTCIFKLDELRQYVNCTYVLGENGFFKDEPKLQKIPLTVIPHWMDMFENEGFVYVDSVYDQIDSETAKFKILQYFDVRNLMAVPIIRNNIITGFTLVSSANLNKGNIQFLETTSIFLKDALDKKYANERLETLLNYDRLTGLFNRHYYHRVLERIKNEQINDIGIIYIDVNGLKKMNDNFGHSYGDCYIENCAELIKSYFPGESFRIGGDEFIVLTNTLVENEFNLKVKAFEKDLEENNKVSMSLGVVWCKSYVDIGNCIKEADRLMYQNKAIYYANIDDVEEYFARNVIDMLQKSAGEQNLKVLYQPKIDLNTKEFIGAEAFLYKIDELGNYIESSVFIPEYESLGNMYLLDLYVLEKCCEFINSVSEELREKIFTSMKFSQQTILAPDIHIECKNICKKFNVEPAKITIEVSEDLGFVESEEIFNKLQVFRKQGFKLSVENFGELNNKKEIIENNFDKVKLNKNLLSDANTNITKYAILEHLIKNYQTISNVDIIINGIEEEEHLIFLSTYDGLIGQGGLISKPLVKTEFLEYLENNKFQ